MIKTKILFLAANPTDTARLRLDKEWREIQESLRRARERDTFDLVNPRTATRLKDFRRAILDECPQILHFSGHGEGEKGILLDDGLGRSKAISGEALAELLKLFTDSTGQAKPLKCVVLNACFSQIQAEVIAKYVPYVIGMRNSINDEVAIHFSTAFYDALGSGRPVDFAFNYGLAAIKMWDLREDSQPILIAKPQDSESSINSSSSELYGEQRIEIPVKENRYGNCVSVNRLYAVETHDSTYQLYFEFQFGAQEVKVPGGRISFGLSRGELELEISQGECKKPAGIEDFIETDQLNIWPNCSDSSNPTWIFEPNPSSNKKYMKCSGKSLIGELGELRINGSTQIKAIFKKNWQHDLYLDDYEVIDALFGGRNLSGNKMLFLLRLFYVQFLRPKLKPYLSLAELGDLELNDVYLEDEPWR